MKINSNYYKNENCQSGEKPKTEVKPPENATLHKNEHNDNIKYDKDIDKSNNITQRISSNHQQIAT